MQRKYASNIFQIFTVILLAISFVMLNGCGKERVVDADGNKYGTIRIGEHLWMEENLKTTRFNDGTPIEMVTGYEEWAELESPAYCWYNNDSTHRDTYGALYNWYAVETGKLCPEGWHVPTHNEWSSMVPSYIGGALKETGTLHWRSPNTGATNQTGFSALPGGYRSYQGTFNLIRASGYWWSSSKANWYSSSEEDTDRVIFRSLQHNNPTLVRHISEKTNGFSVRCVKDE
jgi:uncharacterized protein (TIGR02145 family)